MKVRLSESDRQYVERKLLSGTHGSADEVVAEALRVLRNVERVMPSSRDDLLRELDAGIRDVELGRVREVDLGALKRDLSRKARRAS